MPVKALTREPALICQETVEVVMGGAPLLLVTVPCMMRPASGILASGLAYWHHSEEQ